MNYFSRFIKNDLWYFSDSDDEDDLHGDKASLSESVQPYESDDDPTEEYGGDFDGSKFNEEGSFIGAYGDKRKEATV